jgi:hypothetical protein|nr:MAG TPA: protein of unknown function DUF4355 [Bacteriophage sp.]
MNKKLFEKVKDLCKDTGLSEKYLKAITEKMGGSIEDDSTDDAAIETTANQIADVAKETQGEATRWANKKKDDHDKGGEDDDPDKKGNKGGTNDTDQKKDDPNEKRIKALEDELAKMKAGESKAKRMAEINAAMAKHNIPAKFRDRFAKSISDDEDVEEAVTTLKQDFITAGLVTDDSEGKKAASEKQIDEAADSLLESITVK